MRVLVRVLRAAHRCGVSARSFSAVPFDPKTWSASSKDQPIASLSNAQIASLVDAKKLSLHTLESKIPAEQAVEVRRIVISKTLSAENASNEDVSPLAKLPSKAFDQQEFYSAVHGTNCESVIGYVPIPVGIVGPLVLDSHRVRVPLATTEGALIASTNRGCRAIELAGGASSAILATGMTRAPLLRAPSMMRAAELKQWTQDQSNFELLAKAFDSTTKYGKLRTVRVFVAGRNIFVRFVAETGDAMGMNMVTKGTFAALQVICEQFSDIELISLSGNLCSDKKAAAINWIEGRGRSVSCEVVIPEAVIVKTLKTTAKSMCLVNRDKTLVGSAVAGSLGGFNAHAANIVSALFLATGNDIAQVVESSSCITLMEEDNNNLHASVTMPSIEVGTIGGGTSLSAQRACLSIMGCAGGHVSNPGANADFLARVVAATVLAGEISLIAALATNDLLKSHMNYNRKKDSVRSFSTFCQNKDSSSCS